MWNSFGVPNGAGGLGFPLGRPRRVDPSACFFFASSVSGPLGRITPKPALARSDATMCKVLAVLHRLVPFDNLLFIVLHVGSILAKECAPPRRVTASVMCSRLRAKGPATAESLGEFCRCYPSARNRMGETR